MAWKEEPVKVKQAVNAEQAAPVAGTGDAWFSVIEELEQWDQNFSLMPLISDMTERRLLGIERYGTPVQQFNGRDSLLDAYQEVLDLIVYLKNDELERQQNGLSTLMIRRAFEAAIREALLIKDIMRLRHDASSHPS